MDTVSVGHEKVLTAMREMRGIQNIIQLYAADKPLMDVALLVCVTPTPQTGAFLLALQELGATISACSDNAYASDDDVVAFVNTIPNIQLFAKSHMTKKEYFTAMEKAIANIPTGKSLQIVDDGCDITQYMATRYPEKLTNARAVSEQTTCGINFLKTLYKSNQLTIPAININHSFTKKWFDNYLGIQQSIIHAFSKAGITVTGKKITIFGYGPVGKGAATVLKAHGAHVSIVEKDIALLMQAELEGFMATSLENALGNSDICISATGCVDTISAEDIVAYARDGIMLANIGHGNKEFAIDYLKKNGTANRLNEFTDAYKLDDGREIVALCDGALLNFIAGGGNPSTFMSLTFTLTILAHIAISQGKADALSTSIHSIFAGLETKSVELNFPHLKPLVSKLSANQRNYLHE